MTAQERLRQAWPADWQVGTNPKTSTYLMIGESCLSVAWGALDEVIAGRPLPPVPPWAREALARAQVQRLEGYAKREAEAVVMRAEHDRLSCLVVGS